MKKTYEIEDLVCLVYYEEKKGWPHNNQTFNVKPIFNKDKTGIIGLEVKSIYKNKYLIDK